MIVSAVSVNAVQLGFTNWNTQNESDRISAVVNKQQVSYSKKNQADAEEQKMFEAINEWKYFCHQQILNGNLDVIA